VIVENAGFGAAAAAPIARLAIDYYLTGKRPDEPAPAKPKEPTAASPATAANPAQKPATVTPSSGRAP